MRILQISTSAQVGGAGIAAYRLHKGLRLLGEESNMLVSRMKQREEYLHGPIGALEKIAARAFPILDRIPGRLFKPHIERFSSAWVPDGLKGKVKTLAPDILNLHWVNDGYMRIESLPGFGLPIVWTLHDMWPFAGGEHYVGDSLRYQHGYSRENRPPSASGVDLDRWVWRRKKNSWAQLNDMVIAAPSNWMAKCARDSALFGKLRIEVMPNGVDHARFRPMDHSLVRDILGLPKHKKLLLFGAGSATSDKRKGFDLLVEAIKRLETRIDPEGYELVVFGALSGDTSFTIKTHYLGKLQDEISIALVYAAADVFVAPSIEDNLPNTVLESLASGTPVVAFDVGGMPDMIAHKKNGYLASDFDTADLARGLHWVLENQERWKRLAQAARSTVEDSFTLEHSARRYQELYQDMLNTAPY